jgi:hypothetical protein
MSPDKKALLEKVRPFAAKVKGEIDEEHSTDETVRVLNEFYCYDFDINGTVRVYDFKSEKTVEIPQDELI